MAKSFIQDIVVNLTKQSAATPGTGFGLPLITGDTGMFKSADILIGEAGLNWKLKTRGAAVYANIIYDDPGIPSQALAVGVTGAGTSGDPYIITVDLATDASSNITTRAKDVKTAVEAAPSVNAIVSLSFLGNFGTGVVSAVASTSVSSPLYVELSLASDALKYYNSTDPEYLMAVALKRPSSTVATYSLYNRDGLAGSFTDQMNTLVQTQNSWYGLLIIDRTKTEIHEAGDWALDNKKIFMACTSDDTALDGRSNNREAYIIHDAPTDYPDAELMGYLFSRDVGSATGKWKRLSGQTGTSFSSATLNSIRSRQGIAITEQNGIVFTNEGITTEPGFYIDDRIGMDWIAANIENDILNLLLSVDKLPYDQRGLGQIRDVVAARLKIAANRGLIALAETADEIAASYDKVYQYSVTVPARSAQDPVDVNNRTVKGVQFKYAFAGAVHEIDISGFAGTSIAA